MTTWDREVQTRKSYWFNVSHLKVGYQVQPIHAGFTLDGRKGERYMSISEDRMNHHLFAPRKPQYLEWRLHFGWLKHEQFLSGHFHKVHEEVSGIRSDFPRQRLDPESILRAAVHTQTQMPIYIWGTKDKGF